MQLAILLVVLEAVVLSTGRSILKLSTSSPFPLIAIYYIYIFRNIYLTTYTLNEDIVVPRPITALYPMAAKMDVPRQLPPRLQPQRHLRLPLVQMDNVERTSVGQLVIQIALMEDAVPNMGTLYISVPF